MTIKRRIFLGIKLILFIFITCFTVHLTNMILCPKYYYNSTWTATNTFEDFYNLEKDSIDVLMLGSSHVTTSLNPQVLYDYYGIVSYNLGSEQQSPLVTYYWLKEALKYQSPKVVIIDTYMFHKFTADYVYNDLNSPEPLVRKAMDSMKLSPIKLEAIHAIEQYDPTQSGLSYIMLNVRYHTRWTNLDEDDFTRTSMVSHGGIKGFNVIGGTNANLATYEPFCDAEADQVEKEQMVDVALYYSDKIVELCEENDIELIYVNIPYRENVSRYKANKEYAKERGIPYYDFNEERLYNEIGYNAAENLIGHPNYTGAEKISKYFGQLLSTEYGIERKEDKSFEKSGDLYRQKVNNAILMETTDINEFFDHLDNEKYTIFIFIPIVKYQYLNEELIDKLLKLGFTVNLENVDEGKHYWAIKDLNGVYEKIMDKDGQMKGAFRKATVLYSVSINTGSMIEKEHIYSLKIDGQECGNASPGIDVVVYDNEMKRIIERINIIIINEEITFNRY